MLEGDQGLIVGQLETLIVDNRLQLGLDSTQMGSSKSIVLIAIPTKLFSNRKFIARLKPFKGVINIDLKKYLHAGADLTFK